jgi:hypothetical protein
MRRIAASALIFSASLLTVSATDYDEQLGLKNYYYAAAAYCPTNILQWQCGPPCRDGPQVTEIVQLSNYYDGTLAYVGYNADANEIVVSFRGSANIANWVKNIEVTQTDYPGVEGARVHHGFLTAY